MSKENLNEKKLHVNVDTIGHIDNDKTTLTQAINTTLAKNILGSARVHLMKLIMY